MDVENDLVLFRFSVYISLCCRLRDFTCALWIGVGGCLLKMGKSKPLDSNDLMKINAEATDAISNRLKLFVAIVS